MRKATSMHILIIGAGGVGSAAARIASRRSFFEELTIADYDPARPTALVDAIRDPGIRPPRWTLPMTMPSSN